MAEEEKKLVEESLDVYSKSAELLAHADRLRDFLANTTFKSAVEDLNTAGYDALQQ